MMDQLVEADARAALVTQGARRRAARCARRAPSPRSCRPTTTPCAPPRAPTTRSPSRRSGACARSRSTSTRSTPTSTPTCCSSCTGAARGVKGEAWRKLARARTSSRGWSACGASRTTCTRARCSATSRATARATTSSCSTPSDRETVLDALRLPAPAAARPHLPGRLLPPEGQRRARRRRLQAVTAGDEVTELMAQPGGGRRVRRAAVRPRPRRADRRGPGRVAALEGPRGPRHRPPTQGRRYSWGYPAVPDQSEHEKVDELLDLAADRHDALRRLRARARAVDARDRRPPPAGDLLRHEVRQAADERPPARRRRDRGHRARPDAARRAAGRRPGRRARTRPSTARAPRRRSQAVPPTVRRGPTTSEMPHAHRGARAAATTALARRGERRVRRRFRQGPRQRHADRRDREFSSDRPRRTAGLRRRRASASSPTTGAGPAARSRSRRRSGAAAPLSLETASPRGPARSGGSTAHSAPTAQLGTSICAGSVLVVAAVRVGLAGRPVRKTKALAPGVASPAGRTRRSWPAVKLPASRAALRSRATSPAADRAAARRRPCSLVQPRRHDPDAEGHDGRAIVGDLRQARS